MHVARKPSLFNPFYSSLFCFIMAIFFFVKNFYVIPTLVSVSATIAIKPFPTTCDEVYKSIFTNYSYIQLPPMLLQSLCIKYLLVNNISKYHVNLSLFCSMRRFDQPIQYAYNELLIFYSLFFVLSYVCL